MAWDWLFEEDYYSTWKTHEEHKAEDLEELGNEPTYWRHPSSRYEIGAWIGYPDEDVIPDEWVEIRADQFFKLVKASGQLLTNGFFQKLYKQHKGD